MELSEPQTLTEVLRSPLSSALIAALPTGPRSDSTTRAAFLHAVRTTLCIAALPADASAAPYTAELATAHKSRITAVCVGEGGQVLSVSDDAVMLWRLQALPLATVDVVDDDDSDRTFKLWSLDSKSCVYQSGIISASAFTAVTATSNWQTVFIGSQDGRIRVYQLDASVKNRSLPVDVRHIGTVDTEKELQKFDRAAEENAAANEDAFCVVSSTPAWRAGSAPTYGSFAAQTASDLIAPLQNAQVSQTILQLRTVRMSSIKADSSAEQPILIAATPSRLLCFNIDTLSLASAHSFTAAPTGGDGGNIVGLISCMCVSVSAAITDTPLSAIATVGVCSRFQPRLYALDMRPSSALTSGLDIGDDLRMRLLDPDVASMPLWSVVELITVAQLGDRWYRRAYAATMEDLHARNVTTMQELSVAQDDALSTLPQYLISGLRLLLRHHYSGTQHHRSLAFAPVAELSTSSPLRSGFVASVATGQRSKASTAGKNGKGIALNKPVTFRSKVSSSGYGSTASPTQLFKRPVSSKSKPTTSKKVVAQPLQSSLYNAETDLSFSNDNLPTRRLHQAPITALRYSPNGKYVGTSSMDKLCCVASTSLSERSGDVARAYACPGAGVVDLTWACGSDQFLAASSTAVQLWSVAQTDTPVLTVDCPGGNYDKAAMARSDSGFVSGDPAGRPVKRSAFTAIRAARLFYGDKFILVADKHIHMLKYHLESATVAKDSIRPKLVDNKYKAVTTFASPSAHAITSLYVSNQSRSPLIVAGASNKSLCVFDANANQLVQTWQDAHERAIHCIHANDGLLGTDAEPRHMLCTAAVSDCVRIWDMRAAKCVKRLQGHQNRFANVGCALSPCERYVATGSEDNSVYIFDMRASRLHSKMSGFGDTVLSVDWHPYRPEVACATAGGQWRVVRAQQ
ncbi:hypothetical protein RI367_000378 [Sorochytrium milnesiophthora]